MKRTSESYQAALNAVRASTGGGPVNAPVNAPPLRCDVCTEDLLDDPDYAMVQWLYKTEPPFRDVDVVALFFCHKGACDQLVQGISRKMKLSDSWTELYTLVGEQWYRSSNSVRQGKNWGEAHDERLDSFFEQIRNARERGWRPLKQTIRNVNHPEYERDRKAFLTRSTIREEIIRTDTRLPERVMGAFASEWLAEAVPGDVAKTARVGAVTCAEALPRVMAAVISEGL